MRGLMRVLCDVHIPYRLVSFCVNEALMQLTSEILGKWHTKNVQFTVPDEVNNAFNATFANQDKNAIISDLMREAVERAKRQQQRREAIRRILDRRSRSPIRSESEIAEVRCEGRP